VAVNKTALITGISGQDGAYLSEKLIGLGYRVIGLKRGYNYQGIHGLQYLGIEEKVVIEECDLLDISQIIKLLIKYRPDEIYNLAAQSSVSQSFLQPIGTFQFNTLSVYNLLESIKLIDKKIRFYQASSSEMYGRVEKLPITESSLLHPLSPYAISKASSHWICKHYRESYGIYVSCGILFNHESYLRSNNFFVKKIVIESIKISRAEQKDLIVGNIDIKRDFGYAPKYIEAMYLMMQKQEADDYIVCSGKSVSLRSMIYYLFDKLNISHVHCIISDELFRPADIIDIYGDNSKAKSELNWQYDMTAYELLDILLEQELKNYAI
jgi:GDPmannose 4,6-dehydratase